MKTKRLYGLLLISLVGLYCSTVPIIGRKQLIIVPDSQILSMSNQEYTSFMQSHRLSQNAQQVALVRAVGQKLRAGVERYLASINQSSLVKDFVWEFNLVESNEINAWAMPGGKVVFYTGILPVTRNEAGIAVVMGHEIAHVVARHGSERVSQGLLTQYGGAALSVLLKDKPQETQQLWLSAFGLGAQVGILLPYSRTHEKEADRLGMIFMAIAGYDPNHAVDFWQRMAQMNTGTKPPEFLSTHPSDSTRIRLLRESLPEAMSYYGK
ncbi:MAG: M48 family metallopeptidase [Spirochaetes bacterium]|nr:M48 family metallopeptidase [Spirochaetota bacterium]